MTGRAHLEQVAALRQLAGRELPIHRRLSDLAQAAESLASVTRGWSAFAPRGDALDRAVTQAEAVARALRELRSDMARDAKTP